MINAQIKHGPLEFTSLIRIRRSPHGTVLNAIGQLGRVTRTSNQRLLVAPLDITRRPLIARIRFVNNPSHLTGRTVRAYIVHGTRLINTNGTIRLETPTPQRNTLITLVDQLTRQMEKRTTWETKCQYSFVPRIGYLVETKLEPR